MSEKPIPTDRRYPALTILAHVFQIFAILAIVSGIVYVILERQSEVRLRLAGELTSGPNEFLAYYAAILGGALLAAGMLWLVSELILLFVRMAQDQARTANAAETTAWHTAQYLSRAAKATETTASYIERANAPQAPGDVIETPSE